MIPGTTWRLLSHTDYLNRMDPSHENVDITLLNQLDVSKVNVTIKVRLIKVWKQPSYKITNATHSMECILMDEEFTKIQASIMNTYLIKHEKFLLEGECVLITRFDVGDNLSTYRLTNHAHRLFLKFETMIMKCNDTVGTPRGFLFTEFDVLRNNALPADFVVDVIGYVESYFDMYEHKTKKGELKKRMNLQLRDSEKRVIFVSLWESYAEQMDKYISKKTEGHTAVMILQHGKFVFCDRRAYVSSNFNGSTLYIDEDIDEIIAFRNRLLEKVFDNSLSSRRLVSSQSTNNLQDLFLNKSILSSIDKVNKMVEATSVVVVGTLISFLPGFEWYYNACKACNKKVKTIYVINDALDGSEAVEPKRTIQCPNEMCNKKVLCIVPRYLLPLRLQDNSGIVCLTMLDSEARKMLKMSAKELLDRILDGDNVNNVPKEIYNLIGKKYAFKIDITNFNIAKNYKVFTVTRFTDDLCIVSKLEENLEVYQVEVSQSMNMKSMDFESQDTVNFKDTLSCATDDATPTSVVATSVGTNLLDDTKAGKNNTDSKLKRNLNDVYDIDDSPQQSATKPHPKSHEGLIEVDNPTLLTPKLEK